MGFWGFGGNDTEYKHQYLSYPTKEYIIKNEAFENRPMLLNQLPQEEIDSLKFRQPLNDYLHTKNMNYSQERSPNYSKLL